VGARFRPKEPIDTGLEDGVERVGDRREISHREVVRPASTFVR
jgi:hypothetical protein